MMLLQPVIGRCTGPWRLHNDRREADANGAGRGPASGAAPTVVDGRTRGPGNLLPATPALTRGSARRARAALQRSDNARGDRRGPMPGRVCAAFPALGFAARSSF